MTIRSSFAIAAALFVLAAPAPASAQTALGIKGGLSFGDVSNRGVLPGDLGTRTGFAVGLSVGTGPGAVSVGAEALYAQRGVETRELDYLDVPAYLRLGFPDASLTPYLYAGPQLSWEIRCDAGALSCPTGRSETSYAAVIGGGIRLGETGSFSLEGRYIYGLTDLRLGTITTDESYQTRSFMLLAGFGF